MLTNGKYNNAAYICLYAFLIMFLGPIYAILYSLPLSILFPMIASFDCFCLCIDMNAWPKLALLLLPFRLLQALGIMILAIIFNVIFWSIMYLPAQLICICWGSRMLYYWTIGICKLPTKASRARISAIYNTNQRKQIKELNTITLKSSNV